MFCMIFGRRNCEQEMEREATTPRYTLMPTHVTVTSAFSTLGILEMQVGDI